MNSDDSLQRLAASTAEAVLGTLQMMGVSGEVAAVEVLAEGENPLASLPVPSILTSVSYVDGVKGGNSVSLSPLAVKKLAAAMMGMDLSEVDAADAELSELELSALSEAMNQMMAQSAAATSTVIGAEVEISTPTTETYLSSEQLAEAFEETPHVTRARLLVLDEEWVLVQSVPHSFVVRMTSALRSQEGEIVDLKSVFADRTLPLAKFKQIPLRFSVEFGRRRMPLSEASKLPVGALLSLPQTSEELLTILINHEPYAKGRLRRDPDGDLVVVIDQLIEQGRKELTEDGTNPDR